MFNKIHDSINVRIALVLVLITGVFEVTPVRASVETTLQSASQRSFLNSDGTLKLDGVVAGPINLQGYDVRLDSRLGPVFASNKNSALTSAFAQSVPGEWSALGSNLAGNDGALNNGVNAIAVDGINVYVGGGFTDAGGVATADYIAK